MVVAGAGPCGLSLSLALARAGIEVTLVDREDNVDARPRAAHMTAPGVQIFKRAGVYEDVQRAGFCPKDWTFRSIDGSSIVKIEDVGMSRSPDATIAMPSGTLCKILLSHVERNSQITLKWGCKVLDVGQDEDSAWILVNGQDGTEKKLRGDFVCGCDGGTSQVRKSMFGERSFPGKTWDVQFVATDVSRMTRNLVFT